MSPSPWLSGDDLAAFDLKPGPRFGQILEAVYRAQLNETIGTQEEALAMAARMLDEDGR